MIIGLTGSIATGKSTIANELINMGYTVIDADQSARKVVEPGEEAYKKIKETFGDAVFTEDGQLDRPKLGEIIFNDEQKRKQLNEIVHPAVRADMLAQKDQAFTEGKQTVFLDIPLLFESKLQWMVEKVLVVYAPEAVQKERLMKRNDFSEKEAASRIASQIPVEQKREQADAVIDNSGTIEQSIEQLHQLIKDWKLTP
ncbi:dephospho-CoA kinase [Jeotgalibacillus haloalkalitolerans]|uniref:Dephospho-CoA kinase n=1 Tax=Jeotgalibacillus haloalkalitolerans TaxID=3104292 RepID=A0ABU5KMY1_9BACL|nr:dephospho-CoA kinase [Jeotgalibacillus sp. HH7-29]MDZ5712438.1 dephospho-CoA kinase [Jeotgalibacillus sp. HH7-29]